MKLLSILFFGCFLLVGCESEEVTHARYEKMKSMVGTVVRLKSGGPAMTVKDYSNRSLWCVYFDNQGQYQGTYFYLNTIEVVDPKNIEQNN